MLPVGWHKRMMSRRRRWSLSSSSSSLLACCLCCWARWCTVGRPTMEVTWVPTSQPPTSCHRRPRRALWGPREKCETFWVSGRTSTSWPEKRNSQLKWKKCIEEWQLQCERWMIVDQDLASWVARQRNSFELLWTIVSSPQPLLRLHFPSRSRLGNANHPLDSSLQDVLQKNEKLKFGLMAFIMAENIHITITNEIICNNNLITQNESFVLMQL